MKSGQKPVYNCSFWTSMCAAPYSPGLWSHLTLVLLLHRTSLKLHSLSEFWTLGVYRKELLAHLCRLVPGVWGPPETTWGPVTVQWSSSCWRCETCSTGELRAATHTDDVSLQSSALSFTLHVDVLGRTGRQHKPLDHVALHVLPLWRHSSCKEDGLMQIGAVSVC